MYLNVLFENVVVHETELSKQHSIKLIRCIYYINI